MRETKSGRIRSAATACAILLPALIGTAEAGAQVSASDSAAVVRVVEQFHHALAAGDSATALGLLDEGAVILESGGLETREEYAGHHLPADMAFAAAVPGETGPLRVYGDGETAWVASTTRRRGEFRGQAIDMTGAELMVLNREPDGWRIVAIHWSSRSEDR